MRNLKTKETILVHGGRQTSTNDPRSSFVPRGAPAAITPPEPCQERPLHLG